MYAQWILQEILYIEQLNYVEVKFVWQISYPPVKGASLGSYLFKKMTVKNSSGSQM